MVLYMDARTFKDKQGRTWTLELDYGHVLELKKLGIDLSNVLEKPENIAEILLSSPHKIVEMLAVICDEQREEYKILPEDFGRSFTRQVLDDASNALIAAILFFFQRTAAGRVLLEKFPEVIAKMDKQTSDRVRSTLSNWDTNIAESSESTPRSH